MDTKVAKLSRPAGFWLRFWAWLFDLAVLLIAFAVVDFAVRWTTGIALVSFLVSLIDRGLTGGLGGLLALAAMLLAWLTVIVVAWFLEQVVGWVYYAVFESSGSRATPGKMVLELQVVDEGGERISFGRATLRHFLKFAPFYPVLLALPYLLYQLGRSGASVGGASTLFAVAVLLVPVLFFIFYGMAGWTRDKRALHDIVSGCHVVRGQPMSAGRTLGTAAGVVALFLMAQVIVPAVWNIYDSGTRISARAERPDDATRSAAAPTPAPESKPSEPESPAKAETEATAQATTPPAADNAPAADASPPPTSASLSVPVPQPPSMAARTASGAELHIVGIGNGAYAPGTDTRPWWAKCKDDPTIKNDSECHSRYAGKREPSFAKVTVSYNRGPIVLALLGSDPVTWDVHIAPDANVERIILAGSYRQEIKGVDASIPIEVYGDKDAFACPNCTMAGRGFYAYDAGTGDYDNAMRKLKEITGSRPASVQLVREGGEFYVGPAVKRYDELPAPYKRWER